MNLVIWGAGINGKKCGKIFEKYLKEDRIICYIDNDKNKLRNDDIPVLTAGTLKILYENNLLDKIIVPGYEPAVYRNIMQQLYGLKIDYRPLLFYAETEYFEEKLQTMKTFAELIEEAKKQIPLIGALEYEVYEQCNLNCKRCNHYSNIFSSGKAINYETFCKDLKAVSKKAYNIKRFKILGGEPLLNKELYKFVPKSREIFPKAYIAIVTNGILIRQMSDKLIKEVKEAGVVIEISVYPPLKEHQDIEAFLKKKQIEYKVFRYGSEFGAYLNPKGDSEPFTAMLSCYGQVCHALKNGKLYKCATGQNIKVLNQRYGTHFPEIDFNLEGESRTAEEITEYLVNPVELCQFCSKMEYYPWEQTKGDDKLEDWLVKNN